MNKHTLNLLTLLENNHVALDDDYVGKVIDKQNPKKFLILNNIDNEYFTFSENNLDQSKLLPCGSISLFDSYDISHILEFLVPAPFDRVRDVLDTYTTDPEITDNKESIYDLEEVVIDSFFEHGDGKELLKGGQLIIKYTTNEYFGGEDGKDFTSKTLTNPTIEDILNEVNNAIHTNRDYHHVFLEGYDILNEENNIKTIEIFFGS